MDAGTGVVASVSCEMSAEASLKVGGVRENDGARVAERLVGSGGTGGRSGCRTVCSSLRAEASLSSRADTRFESLACFFDDEHFGGERLQDELDP